MSANPTVFDPTAYVSGTDVIIEYLYTNQQEGVVSSYGGNFDTQQFDRVNTRIDCIPQVTGILKLKSRVLVRTLGIFNFAELRIYTCAGTENCAAPSCSTWNTSYNNRAIDIPVHGSEQTPSAPSGVVVTPGNGQLTVSWIQNANTWVYLIYLLQGATVLQYGYLSDLRNERSVVFSGLTNNVQYTIELMSINHMSINGKSTITYGTPLQPCTTPICGFTIST